MTDMRKLFNWMFAAVLICCGGGLTSCVVNDDNPVADDPSEYEDPAEFEPTVRLLGKAYLAAGLDENLMQAFKWAVSDVVNAPEADVDFVIVNKLTDVSEDYLKEVYSNGKVIAVWNPDAAELEAYKDSHDWLDIYTYNVDNSLMIFAFNNHDDYYYVKNPIVDEDFDPILLQMMAAQNYYAYISSMLGDVMEYINGVETYDKEDAARFTAAARKAAGEKTAKMEDFAGHTHEHVYQSFPVSHTFRQLALDSDPDQIHGNLELNTEYDIYTVHVYEGAAGAGDYYGMKMNATVNSAGLWKGKGWNRHGLVHVRWCGAYTTDFWVESHLATKMSTLDADWNEDTNDRIMFPASGAPSPETTVDKTSYEDKNGFSLNFSHSIGGKAGVTDKGGELAANIDLINVKYGWEWTHSERRDIKDVDILNERKKGNWARWHLVFNNLPEWKFSESRCFDLKNNQASRSSQSIHGVWMWYDRNGKDNQSKKPYAIDTWLKAKLAVQSWWATYSDLETSTFEREDKDSRWMPTVVNVTGGAIKLKNDLRNDSTISDVVVSRADNGKKVTEYRHTITNGGERVLGFFNSNHEYMMTFKARKKNGNPRNYKYTLQPTLTVNHKDTTTVYANSDFSLVQ